MTLFLIFALTIFAAIFFAIKDRQNHQQLDERQLLLRGRGYKYAFWTVLVANVLYSLASIHFDHPLATPFVASLATIMLGGTVFSCYCIFQDAFPVKNKRGWVVAWILVYLSLLSSQFAKITSGRVAYINNGMLTDEATGPMILATYLAILVSFLIKVVIDRREED